jgi:hypothetical protein
MSFLKGRDFETQIHDISDIELPYHTSEGVIVEVSKL